MNSLHIRPATAVDYQAICALVMNAGELLLVHPSGNFPWTVTQLEKLANERFDLTVLESTEGIIGFANLYGLKAQHYAFIGNVIITHSQRSNGYARQLLEHLLERLLQVHRLPEARISVFADNTPALKLYQSLGFRHYAEEQRRMPCGLSRKLLHLRIHTLS